MGLILDSSVLIAAERQPRPVSTPEIAHRRRLYLDSVFAAIPVQPFTKEMGQLAARIDAEARKRGLVIPFAAALHFGYAIGTLNIRHFQMIPNLVIQQL